MGSAIMMISGLTDLQIWSTLPCGCCYHSPLPLCALPYITFRHAVLVVCQPRNKKKAHKFDPIHFFLQNPHNFTIHSLLEDVFTCHHVSAWQPAFNLGRAPDLLLCPPFKASSSPHPPDTISLHQHSNNLAADDSETASAFVCVWNPSVLSAY